MYRVSIESDYDPAFVSLGRCLSRRQLTGFIVECPEVKSTSELAYLFGRIITIDSLPYFCTAVRIPLDKPGQMILWVSEIPKELTAS